MTTGPWSFDVPRDAAVVTTTYVTREGMPILFVAHDYDAEEDEDLWQFHCGNGDLDPAVLQLVGLGEIVAMDSTLIELANLPVGSSATRAAAGEARVIEASPTE